MFVVFMLGKIAALARISRLGGTCTRALSMSSLETFSKSGSNTLREYLVGIKSEGDKQFRCRQLQNLHYVDVRPEPSNGPLELLHFSQSMAEELGIDVTMIEENEADFAKAFAGNTILEGFNPYATVYGCSCYGTWFGQLGDGRAHGLGEVVNAQSKRYELQLKGCGRSPFSRNFDGRAVVRSSVREFLASEAMHALGVSTTRALSLVGTGESIRRAWYLAASTDGPSDKPTNPHYAGKHPPDRLKVERGAVLCRVAPSFLRFAQLELFAKRNELDELVTLADYACFREFPELLSEDDYTATITTPAKKREDGEEAIEPVKSIRPGDLSRYVSMYRRVAENACELVSNWIRVGYCQGNMNSDNTLLGGRTLDYGPYGFVEAYDPLYQPFTSDQDGKFSFMRQPSAMHMNLVTLSDAFDAIIRHRGASLNLPRDEVDTALKQIETIVRKDFPDMFQGRFNAMRASKMGLLDWNDADALEYAEFDQLKYKSSVDYIMFYRLLGVVSVKDSADEALTRIEPAFYDASKVDLTAWQNWFDSYYLPRIRGQEAILDDAARKALMDRTNPKFILRNWMGTLAYEKAEKGDYSVLKEIHSLLSDPYAEQSDELSEKYFALTPDWARNMPGVAFMS